MDRGGSRKGGGGKVKKQKENDLITNHYPWLITFDQEAKSFLTEGEVTVGHVLKLITLLEGHVSPEVSRLKTRPNRATKFLAQIRKKISMVMAGGMMIDGDVEKDIYPTYGLLMTHVVNINLVSSKVEKLGGEKVAIDLYYFLKLLFQGDNEYLLDVVLCSTLDEHSNSKDKVGYKIFSFIVEDWRLYLASLASQMKYYAICSLLAESCEAGNQVVDRFVSRAKPEQHFLEYLSDRVDPSFGVPRKMEKFSNMRAVVNHLKPTAVKSISRSRLVVVSRRDIAGGRDHSGSSDSSSVTINLASNRNDLPTSSVYSQEDPMNEILGELGLGGGFFLDTCGGGYEVDNSSSGDYDATVTDYMNQNDQVSSSTRRKRFSSSSSAAGKLDMKRKMDELSWKDSEDEDRVMPKLSKSSSYKFSSPDRGDSPSSLAVQASSSPPRRSSGRAVVAPVKDQSPKLQRKSISQRKREEQVVNSDDEMSDRSREGAPFERNSEAEEDDDDESSLLPLGADAMDFSTEKVQSESDSDLEVLSVIDTAGDGKDSNSEASDGSHSRDEEEAESGEDVVPNYDIDSDAEENGTVGNDPEGAPTKSPALNDEDGIVNNENEEETLDSSPAGAKSADEERKSQENTEQINDSIAPAVDNASEQRDDQMDQSPKLTNTVTSPDKVAKSPSKNPEPSPRRSQRSVARKPMGRPPGSVKKNLPKPEVAESANDTTINSECPTPAKRGRQKRNVADTSICSSTVAVVEEATPVRRSSRLRK